MAAMATATHSKVGGVRLSSRAHLNASSVRPSQSKRFRTSTQRSTARLVIKAQAGKDRDVSAQAAEVAAAPVEEPQKGLLDSLVHGLTQHYKKASKEAARSKFKRLPATMRIEGQWYDCSGWAAAHPGGSRWIHWFHGRDATAVFYAFHSYGPNGSSLAINRLSKLQKVEAPPVAEQKLPMPKEMDANVNFQTLRRNLEEQGFFKRSVWKEALALAQVVLMYAVGTTIAYSHPIWATIILGIGAQQAGWLAHDYIHGRGKWCKTMRWFGAVFNGHSAEWWTQKHSLHHTFTNEEKHDNDILMEPFFFLRSPKESGRPDSPARKWQHIYGYPLLGIMYWLWRALSIQTAWHRKDKYELCLMAINYSWMALFLPPAVAIGHVFLGGFLVGALVSATHQSEEVMADGDEPDFITGQFRSTRDADTVAGPVETWLWGGMDTQLEHHLFPTIPRYNYHRLRPILKAWAEAHGCNYRISPSSTIISDNWKLLDTVAHA